MKFRLWGTRGSLPSPLRSEEIEAKIVQALSGASGVDLGDPLAVKAYVASLPHHVRGTAGGDTSCLEVRSGDNLLIFDCGSGMRRLGNELVMQEFGRGQGEAHIFLSHTHWDHMMGWPFFVPAYIPGNKFTIYGVHEGMRERFLWQQKAPAMFPVSLEYESDQFDYMSSKVNFVQLQEGETVQIGQTSVRNIRLDHPGGSYGYRVEDKESVLAYATDSTYQNPLDIDAQVVKKRVEFFRDADALVFDAMFSLRETYLHDWGHSSAIAGVRLAAWAGVRRLFLFHHAPAYNDEVIWKLYDNAMEYLQGLSPRPDCQIIVAYDGLEMDLWREAHLESYVEKRSEGVVVHLKGRITEETGSEIDKALVEAQEIAPRKPIVINLAQVVGIDKPGIVSLLAARRRVRPLALTTLTRELRHTLSQAGCLDFFVIFDMPDAALSALSQGITVRPGQVLHNRFEIVKWLGQGPLGDVFMSTDQVSRQPVAIKVLCPSISPLGIERLVAAAEVSMGIRHPTIGAVYKVGQDGALNYIAVEYLSGQNLRQLLAQDGDPTPQPARLLAEIGLAVSQTLEFAHSRGLVHAGLKPENIILPNSIKANVLDPIEIKVTDFGVARLGGDKPLTEVPAYLGRLDYLAPEQIEGRGASPVSDLYALGVTLYEMATGQTPFSTTIDDDALISLKLRQQPVPPRRRGAILSRSLEYLILKLLRRSPRERYTCSETVSQVLTGLLPSQSSQSLLGRDVPLRVLREHLTDAIDGDSRLVFLSGSVGIGKSLLAQSVVNDKGSESVAVICGQVFADEDQRPFKLIASALRSYLLSLPAHQLNRLLDQLGERALSLVTLMPEVDPLLPAFDNRLARSNGERLNQTLITFFEKLVSIKPVLLVLDGLHWADDASLRFITHLAKARIKRMFVIGLYRSDMTNQEHLLAQLVANLEKEQLVDDRLQVMPLGPIDIHKLSTDLCHLCQMPSDFSLWLYGETEGNPFYVEQLVKAYLEGPGEARHPRERDALITLEDVILRRLERLPDTVLAMLRQAAVIGQIFSFDTLQTALDASEASVLADLDAALQADFIVGSPHKDRYRFSHPYMREVVYAEMLSGLRRRLHRRVAHVLEMSKSDSPMDEVIDQLAFHFVRGGQYRKALSYLARAIRRSRSLYALGVAVRYVDQALETLDNLTRATSDTRELEQRHTQRQELQTARTKLLEAMQETVEPD